MKINKHIEIVRSSKTWLNSMSQESCDAIFGVLSQRYAKVGVSTIDSFADLAELTRERPDLVFLGMKFVPAKATSSLQSTDKIWVAGYLEDHGITCTGSSHAAHRLEFDKSKAKKTVLAAGLKTSPYYVAYQAKAPALSQALRFPLFVKPDNRGGGLGIDSASLVHDEQQLRSKVHAIAAELKSDSLVEEYLPGREFSVAILKKEAAPGYLVMPLELIAPEVDGARLLSAIIKSSNTEIALKIADSGLKSRVEGLAMDVFHALGARDYGRIDIRLDRFGTAHFLEANLLPSLIEGYGSFPKACLLNINLGYETMILSIVQLAFDRSLAMEEELETLTLPFHGMALEAA